MNSLMTLETQGQSVWLDFISRELLVSGRIRSMIEQDGLKGMTSNPAIFEKAIDEGSDYDAQIGQLLDDADLGANAIYEALAVEDIRLAADALRTVYDRSNRTDGYISLEVSPYLARDTAGTIDEGRRLWKWVDRPNLMVKVPATPEGVPAIRQLISEGVNVNVTLLFAVEPYEKVASAFIDGLEAFGAHGGEVSKVASVASFFISRIDSTIDAMLAKRAAATSDSAEKKQFERLLGAGAIANAKLTYRRFKEIYSGGRWESLAARGAQPQRLLWASTGTKNKNYSDVLYVAELIGPRTVNTMPPATMDAFRDHGMVRPSLEEGLDQAAETMRAMAAAGVSMPEVADRLVREGLQLFSDAADKVLGAVEGKRAKLLGPKLNSMTWRLPAEIDTEFAASLEQWRKGGRIRRLWRRDPTLWTAHDEDLWLGWLDIAGAVLKNEGALLALTAAAREVEHVLLLGMGGSSLGPEVIARTFGRQAGHPALHVLDSTDPTQIKAFEDKVDLAKTLFIVSSKSGGTIEPNILKQYFFERVKSTIGADKAGQRFIAITDPGSHVERVAEADRFRAVFAGRPSIGGRYSVLSNFGMVPAAAMGIDVGRFLKSTGLMVESCGPSVPPSANPGVLLGAIMGVCGLRGRDKVTIVASPGIAAFGGWAEQLIAESTGKLGKGLIPVDGEPLGPPGGYGADRLFISLGLAGEVNASDDALLEAITQGGHPVVRIVLSTRDTLGQEFFRWEVATAVAGSILGVNPFDQPDVEASKVATKKLTAAYELTGALPAESPFWEIDGIKFFADPANAAQLSGHADANSLADLLRAHFARIQPGDYVALLAYVRRDEATIAALQEMRIAIRDRRKVATVVGFGPRFLHSTGQAYKGGPNTGVFLQITCNDAFDLPVPDQEFSFGVVKAAQAQGDLSVLFERHRRALRVHLPSDLRSSLSILGAALRQALQ